MLNLRIARLKAGLSQREVAERLNVNINTVSRWENGTQKIQIDSLVMLADLYNSSADYLLGRKGYEN
jgi:transcriptional regulator with XRE-family HTH domain